MPKLNEMWKDFGSNDWENFAKAWLVELRREGLLEESEIDESVVIMNFTAKPEQQWVFILATINFAESDDELGSIAAGPIEHLLGKFGKDYIEIVEKEATNNLKFSRAMTGVWKYMIDDDIWERIKKLQANVKDPLPAYKPEID